MTSAEQQQSPSYDNLFVIRGEEGFIIATSSEANEVSVWSVSDPSRKVRTLKNINQPKDLKMVNRHRALILCNRELRLYDLNQGTLVTKLKGVMNQKMPFYGLMDESYCIALSRNRMTVNIMSLESGDLTTTFKVGEDRFLNSLLVSANGSVCVCGDETQKPFPLLVWDLKARKLLYDLRFNHHDFITRLSCVSDDAHYVVSVAKEVNTSSPNFIVVYDLTSGMLFKKWKPEVNSTCICISSASKCVVNGVEGGDLMVWDLSTGDKRFTLKGHTHDVDTLRISETGKIVLSYDSTGKDGVIRVWGVESGKLLTEFSPSSDSSPSVSCCQLSLIGDNIIYTLPGQLEVLTLPLNLSPEDLSTTTSSKSQVYGDEDKEGKEFVVQD